MQTPASLIGSMSTRSNSTSRSPVAEKITPELIHGHHGARVVTRELLQLSGLRPRPKLRDLAERFGVLP